jgi:AcrR family transcriptional regulator
MKKTASIKEKIIIAAIECTEKKGIHLITIRDIAKQAKVNIAAINYYFGTKEELLKEMLAFTLYKTLAENYEEIEKAHKDPYLMMKALLMDFLQGGLRYPNLTKAHFYGPLMNNDYSGVSVEWFSELLSKLEKKISKSKLSAEVKKNVKVAAAQMISTIFFVVLMPRLFDKYFNINFKESPKKQEEYVEQLLQHYLGVPRAGKRP